MSTKLSSTTTAILNNLSASANLSGSSSVNLVAGDIKNVVTWTGANNPKDIQFIFPPWPQGQWQGGSGSGVWPPPVIPPNPPLFSMPVLEEGTYDIPGGKMVIKKIMVTDEQLEVAAEEELGHKPTPQEMDEIKSELEEMSHFEERDV
jgi:hypothetical protein